MSILIENIFNISLIMNLNKASFKSNCLISLQKLLKFFLLFFSKMDLNNIDIISLLNSNFSFSWKLSFISVHVTSLKYFIKSLISFSSREYPSFNKSLIKGKNIYILKSLIEFSLRQ